MFSFAKSDILKFKKKKIKISGDYRNTVLICNDSSPYWEKRHCSVESSIFPLCNCRFVFTPLPHIKLKIFSVNAKYKLIHMTGLEWMCGWVSLQPLQESSTVNYYCIILSHCAVKDWTRGLLCPVHCSVKMLCYMLLFYILVKLKSLYYIICIFIYTVYNVSMGK